MIKSVSALLFYVADVDRTLAFYQELGFQQIKSGSDRREVRLNWFRLKFVDRKSASGSAFKSEASAGAKGTGQ